MNLLIAERRVAVKRLEAHGLNISRRISLDGLVKSICRVRGDAFPPHRDAKIKLVQKFIGPEPIVELPPFQPLKQSRAMKQAMERCAEYRQPGFTDKMRLTKK